MLNYGDLEILTAAELAVDRYHMINDAQAFKKTMLTQKHNLETEFMYGRPPTPPLRADERTCRTMAAAQGPRRPHHQPPAPAAATRSACREPRMSRAK